MTAEGNHLRYGLPLARDILERLRRGEQPTGRELADAMCIEQWRLVPGEVAPYLLAGTVAEQAISEVLIALDPAVGWARTVDRWFVLGNAAPADRPLPSASELMRDVAAWIDRQLGGAGG
jgi:hypothetical protein